MLAEIAGGLSSLRTMKDIVQGLNAAKTEAAINGVKIELQGLILEAQQGLFAAQEAQSSGARRIADLEHVLGDADLGRPFREIGAPCHIDHAHAGLLRRPRYQSSRNHSQLRPSEVSSPIVDGA